jgi:hypothetical protein
VNASALVMHGRLRKVWGWGSEVGRLCEAPGSILQHCKERRKLLLHAWETEKQKSGCFSLQEVRGALTACAELGGTLTSLWHVLSALQAWSCLPWVVRILPEVLPHGAAPATAQRVLLTERDGTVSQDVPSNAGAGSHWLSGTPRCHPS